MPNYSLLLAHTLEAADFEAAKWGWDKVGDLGRHEWRRSDTGEHIRFVHDSDGHGLNGLRWNTKVYLASDWRRRQDASHVMGMLDSAFLIESDPQLPPPRARRKKDDVLGELQATLDKLQRGARR